MPIAYLNDVPLNTISCTSFQKADFWENLSQWYPHSFEVKSLVDFPSFTPTSHPLIPQYIRFFGLLISTSGADNISAGVWQRCYWRTAEAVYLMRGRSSHGMVLGARELIEQCLFLFNLLAGRCHMWGNGPIPGHFADFKGLVVQMALVHNMEGCNMVH